MGCTYRKLDYWCRRGVVPTQPEVIGSGYSRRFTDNEVAGLMAVAKLNRFLQSLGTQMGVDLAKAIYGASTSNGYRYEGTITIWHDGVKLSMDVT